VSRILYGHCHRRFRLAQATDAGTSVGGGTIRGMRAPAGLSTIARGAFKRPPAPSRRRVGTRAPCPAPCAATRSPWNRLETLRESWIAEGRPATVLGARGQTVAHPTLAELRALEAHLDDTLKRLGVLLAARSGRIFEPRARRAAVHQPAHGRVPPPQGLHQAADRFTYRAPAGAVQRAARGARELSEPWAGGVGVRRRAAGADWPRRWRRTSVARL
jgi:hypothetical protein